MVVARGINQNGITLITLLESEVQKNVVEVRPDRSGIYRIFLKRAGKWELATRTKLTVEQMKRYVIGEKS